MELERFEIMDKKIEKLDDIIAAFVASGITIGEFTALLIDGGTSAQLHQLDVKMKAAEQVAKIKAAAIREEAEARVGEVLEPIGVFQREKVAILEARMLAAFVAAGGKVEEVPGG